MSVWDSGFGNSKAIKWLKEQVDILLGAAGYEEIDISSKVDKPETFTLGNFGTYNTSTEELEDTGYNAASFAPADYELSMPVPGSYPYTYNVNTIAVTGDACRTAFIIATLGHAADLSQNRTEIFLVLLDNSETPVVVPQGSGLKGTDFDGNLAFSINDGYLRVSYTVTDGAENPTYLKLKIINL